jgi:hypothetical protein
MKETQTAEANKGKAGERTQVNWAAMSDAQLGYQFECFELHREKIPADLQREIDKRNSAREYDPEGSSAAIQLAERLVGA